MLKQKTSFSWAALSVTVALIGTSTLGNALGSSGGGGSTTTGGGGATTTKIYYSFSEQINGSSVTSVARMNGDGTSKSVLFSNAAESFKQVLSYNAHEAGNWFVGADWDYDWVGEFPDWVEGPNAHAILRFTSPSGVSTTVDLPVGLELGDAHWVPGDAEVSLSGRRMVDGVSVEAGLYGAAITYGPYGDPIGVSTPYCKYELGYTSSFGYDSQVGAYDWNSAGTAIVFSRRGVGGLWILDAGGLRLLRNAAAVTPAWSGGAASMIAYGDGPKLCVIGSNGAGYKELVKLTRPNSTVTYPRWSPDGASIVYRQYVAGLPNESGVYKVSVAGGKAAKMVVGTPLGWR
jgi:hypothetical protein